LITQATETEMVGHLKPIVQKSRQRDPCKPHRREIQVDRQQQDGFAIRRSWTSRVATSPNAARAHPSASARSRRRVARGRPGGSHPPARVDRSDHRDRAAYARAVAPVRTTARCQLPLCCDRSLTRQEEGQQLDCEQTLVGHDLKSQAHATCKQCSPADAATPPGRCRRPHSNEWGLSDDYTAGGWISLMRDRTAFFSASSPVFQRLSRSMNSCHSSGTALCSNMALTGHSGSQAPQSMHSSG
jgi:hypothetical protein